MTLGERDDGEEMIGKVGHVMTKRETAEATSSLGVLTRQRLLGTFADSVVSLAYIYLCVWEWD